MPKIASTLGLKSMAYEQCNDYASIDHDHDIYTSAYVVANNALSDMPLVTLDNTTSHTSTALSVNSYSADHA